MDGVRKREGITEYARRPNQDPEWRWEESPQNQQEIGLMQTREAAGRKSLLQRNNARPIEGELRKKCPGRPSDVKTILSKL